MSAPLRPDYGQTFLFPPSLDEWVGPDHPVRLIVELVDDAIERGILPKDEPTAKDGRPAYAASLLLKIWIYAYSSGLRSTRRAEWACQNVVPMMWLSGTLCPDHTTLSRFWKKHRSLVRQLYTASVRLATDLGLVGMVLQGVDGTKLQAACSTRRAMTPKQAELLKARLEVEINEIEAEIEAALSAEQKAPLEQKVADKVERKKAIEKALSEWPEGDRKQALTEPDARMLVGVGMGYNAQAVVDERVGIIVTQDVVVDANDQHQLIPMLDKQKNELGRVAAQTVADGGYNTGEALAAAEERGYEVIVNQSGDERKAKNNPYHASRFCFDTDRDVVICPEGKELIFKRSVRRTREQLEVRIYRGTACDECPVRTSCTTRSDAREVEIRPYQRAVQANRQRREDPENKRRLKSRISFGERPFAVIKRVLGFRRFRLTGMDGASTEWSFVTAVYNLMTLIWKLQAPIAPVPI